MKRRCITCKEHKCVCIPSSNLFESPYVCLVAWLDPDLNVEYNVQPCPKAKMVSQFELENFKQLLTTRGVDLSSIRIIVCISGRVEEGYCEECLGTGYIAFEAWGLYDPDCLVSCYYCEGTGKDDDPQPNA